MKVWVVTEQTEHDESDYTDGIWVIGVFKDKVEAINFVNEHYEDERLGRGLDESADVWLDHNGAFLRDDEDACEISWAIEPHEVW